jgi:hypothetical protein
LVGAATPLLLKHEVIDIGARPDMSTKLFPAILIVLDVFAAVGYASNGFSDWRKVVYWLAAAVLTTVVTF